MRITFHYYKFLYIIISFNNIEEWMRVVYDRSYLWSYADCKVRLFSLFFRLDQCPRCHCHRRYVIFTFSIIIACRYLKNNNHLQPVDQKEVTSKDSSVCILPGNLLSAYVYALPVPIQSFVDSGCEWLDSITLKIIISRKMKRVSYIW